MFYAADKLGLLIDGRFYSHLMKDLGPVDWTDLRIKFSKKGRLIAPVYVTPIFETDDGVYPLIAMCDHLKHNGYTVHTRKVRDRTLPSDSCVKVEITIEALRMAAQVDHIILALGDASYIPLLQQIRAMGTRITILGCSDCVSGRVIDSADAFIDASDVTIRFVKKED